jgi:hypothetical protein
LAHHLHLCAVDLYAFVLMDNHYLCGALHNQCYVKLGIM